jgi:hypothetical protein
VNSAAVRVVTFLACLLVAFGYGVYHEIEDPSNAVQWTVEASSVIATAVAVVLLHRYQGASLLLAAPILSMAWTAAVLGNFLPFGIGISGRVIDDYNYDNNWQFWLMLNLVLSALGGLVVGLFSAALAAGLLVIGRTKMPGGRRPELD